MWIHHELRATVLTYRVVGLLVIACGVLSVLAPWLWRAWVLHPWIPAGFGIIMLLLGWLALVGAPRLWARAAWVLEHVPPRPMRMRVQRRWWPNELASIEYIAELWPINAPVPGPKMQVEPVMRVRVLPPRWSSLGHEQPLPEQPDSLTSYPRMALVSDLSNVAVGVHIDPSDPGIVVISCPRGIIWPQGKAGHC